MLREALNSYVYCVYAISESFANVQVVMKRLRPLTKLKEYVNASLLYHVSQRHGYLNTLYLIALFQKKIVTRAKHDAQSKQERDSGREQTKATANQRKRP